MAYGIIPISVNVGGQAELIDNKLNGFLIEYNSENNYK